MDAGTPRALQEASARRVPREDAPGLVEQGAEAGAPRPAVGEPRPARQLARAVPEEWVREHRKETAIDVDVLPGDEAGGGRGEEPTELSELHRLPLPPGGRVRHEVVPELLPVRIELRV